MTFSLVLPLVRACLAVPLLSAGVQAEPSKSLTAELPSPAVQLGQADRQLQKLLARRPPSWSPEADMNRSELLRIVESMLDAEELARRALGERWETLPASERARFVSLLSAVTVKSYTGVLMRNPGLQTEFLTAHGDRDDMRVTAVRTIGSGEHAQRIPVEYRLCWKGERWRVYDMVVGGVSAVEEYRAQFNKILARESFAGLMDRMRHKLRDAPRP